MSKLTHIGMVENRGKYSQVTKGPPRAVRLRETKTRWYAGEDRYARWWPKTPQYGGDKVCSGEKSSSVEVVELDLSTVRPMTRKELREPFVEALDRMQRRYDDTVDAMNAANAELTKARDALRVFDAAHGYTPEGE